MGIATIGWEGMDAQNTDAAAEMIVWLIAYSIANEKQMTVWHLERTRIAASKFKLDWNYKVNHATQYTPSELNIIPRCSYTLTLQLEIRKKEIWEYLRMVIQMS